MPKVLSVGSASRLRLALPCTRDARQQAALGDADGGRGDIDVEARGHHRRMLAEGHAGGVVAAARQIAVDGFGRPQLRGRVADHLGVGRLADREIDFGGVEIGKTAVEPRFGLRGVGRRDVAGIEALLGDALGFPQEGDVGALRLDQRLIGQHIGIGGDGVEQHALADIAQRLAAGLHLQFRHPHAVGGLEAVEQGLRHRHPDLPWLQVGGSGRCCSAAGRAPPAGRRRGSR